MANSTTDKKEEFFFPVYVAVLYGLILCILILFGIIGNIFTITAFILDTQLRTVYNTYILNLAVTDLLLCLCSMVFWVVYTLGSYSWPFGYIFCKIYFVIEFTLCLESIWILIIISFDRLLLLKLGSRYIAKISMKHAHFQIGLSWLCSFLLYGPAIIGWNSWTGKSIIKEGDCGVEFAKNVPFTIVTSCIEFVIPFFIVGVLNVLIYREIKQRYMATRNKVSTTWSSELKKNFHRSDLKALKFLLALYIVLFATWTPYEVILIMNSFRKDSVNKHLTQFSGWLLYSKVAMNPFLYAYHSIRFRRNFKNFFAFVRRRKLTKN